MRSRLVAAILKINIVWLISVVLIGAQPVAAQSVHSKPKNIIILFADGTTNGQYEFGRYSSMQLRQQPFAITDVVMAKGRYQLMKTESANYFVTDSAAAASAMSTGYKVNNGAISITPDGKSPPTIMKLAKESGKRIGLVSTAPIYDASPAAFSVHAKSRRDSESIVNQYLLLEPDVLMGGGLNYFLPKAIAGGKRQDDLNVVDAFKAKGYQYIDSPAGLQSIQKRKVLGLFAEEDIDYEIDRNPQEMPSLSQMLAAGLKVLNSASAKDKGFVLFAENENTDSAGHQNDVPAGTNNYQNVGPTQLKMIERYTMSLKEFSEKFKAKAKEGASSAELKLYLNVLLQEGYPGLVVDEDLKDKIVNQGQLEPNSNYLPSNILALAIAKQTGFYWGTSGHTPTPITVAAIGPGSQIFQGVDDNTAFASKLQSLIRHK